MDDRKLIGELWQKYCYKDTQGYKSDREKIKQDYENITGTSIALGTLKNRILELDRENLYIEKFGEEFVNDLTKQIQNSDGSIISVIKRRLNEQKTFTNQELLELHGINPEENEIKQIVSNEWSVTNKDGDTFYNFQSKIIAIPLFDGGISMEEFKKLLQEPIIKVKLDPVGIGVRNLVIGIADTHFPLISFDDLKPYLAEMFEITESGYNKIVIEQLGDIFESSQINESITLKGTILPTVNMVKAIVDSKRLYYQIIDHCLLYCNTVQIEHACGNHSGNLEYLFLDNIKDRYDIIAPNRVIVNHHTDYRTAYQIGNVGIMLSHGDTVALKNLPLKFASEYPLLWGSTEHHECHTGHKHNQFTTVDIDGAVMRQFPTPKPNSQYEDKYGYNSRRFFQLIEYDEDGSKVVYEIG